ncbi:MAG: SEL1-like repeat protein, partial [bacterium]
MNAKEPQDIARLRTEAEAGNASAQYEIGCRFYEGRGVKRDYVEALKWYRMAAEQGNSYAEGA